MKQILSIFLLLSAVLLFAESPRTYLKRGNEALKEKKTDIANQNYDYALEKLPENPYLLYNKGIAAYANKDFNTALKLFKEAQKQSLTRQKHDIDFESKCLAASGDSQFSLAKTTMESQEQKPEALSEAISLCQDAITSYSNSIAVNPKNENAIAAQKQAKLLNKKLLALKQQQPPQQQQNKQDSSKQDKEKQNQQQQEQDKQEQEQDKQQQEQDKQQQDKQQQEQDKQQQQQDKQQQEQDKQQQEQDKQQQEQDKQQQDKQQQEQDKQQQEQDKQQAQKEQQEQDEKEREDAQMAKEIIDQEKQGKKERQQYMLQHIKIEPVQQDW